MRVSFCCVSCRSRKWGGRQEGPCWARMGVGRAGRAREVVVVPITTRDDTSSRVPRSEPCPGACASTRRVQYIPTREGEGPLLGGLQHTTWTSRRRPARVAGVNDPPGFFPTSPTLVDIPRFRSPCAPTAATRCSSHECELGLVLICTGLPQSDSTRGHFSRWATLEIFLAVPMKQFTDQRVAQQSVLARHRGLERPNGPDDAERLAGERLRGAQ